MLTLAAVAADKGIAPTQIDVSIRRKTTEGRPTRTHFDVQIDLGEELSPRERIILFNSARQCKVHKLLSGELTFDYQLTQPPDVETS